MVYVLAVRNYFGLGVSYAVHCSAASALQEALGEGKWAGEQPILKFAISGPYEHPPLIQHLMQTVKVPEVPL